MNLPTLPTDNLYKFIALSGLALLVFSLVFPNNMIDDLELKVVDSQTSAKLLELEVSVLNRDVDVSEAKQKPSLEELLKFRDRGQQLKAKLIQLDGQKEKLSTLLKQLRSAVNFFRLGMFFGALIAYVGFRLWYVRVQRPADLLARKQLEAKDA